MSQATLEPRDAIQDQFTHCRRLSLFFPSLFYPENASGLGSIRGARYIFKDEDLEPLLIPVSRVSWWSKTNPFQNLLPYYLLNINLHSSRPSEHYHNGPSFQRRAIQVSGWVLQCCRLSNDGSYSGLSCCYLNVTSSWNHGGECIH
jgi:hypothetical protein